MNFLDSLDDTTRETLLSIATPVNAPSGSYLVRRGDAGGDLFVVESGRLAVVDTRTRPTTIIATMAAGDVVGEVAFLDRTPRSADVRADTDSSVLHWRRADVAELISQHPHFGARFYEGLCRIAVRRLRRVTTHSVQHAQQSLAPAMHGHADRDADAVATPLKRTLRTVELALRINPQDDAAARELHTALDEAQAQLKRMGAAHTETLQRQEFTAVLRRELQPWLVRSFLAERTLRRTSGKVGSPQTLSHLLVGRGTGDGALGELLDGWLLRRPTMVAIRQGKQALADAVLGAAPKRRGRRILVVNAGTGSLLARLVEGLADIPTSITVLDPSRDALGYFDLTDLPPNISLSAVRHDLAALANGRLQTTLPTQDIVVVDDLLCYLPDRLAMTLFRTLGSCIAPRGALFATALTPSDDEQLLDLLLGWPTVRRTSRATCRLADAVLMDGQASEVMGAPAAVLRVGEPRFADTPAAALARSPSLF
ncbi:MAG: CRP-like cAMP-binding protein [Myxococcota bacterium]|jgi:CRP-like cAMP-binding protein